MTLRPLSAALFPFTTLFRSWKGTVPVGRQLTPTFTGSVIEFRYLLRASLESKDGTVFKCEKPVKIGTWIAGEVKTTLDRSEEHTLNSSHLVISYAVFCLKKK